MPESKSGSNLRQIKAWQRDVARAEYLRHPDSSISDVAKATGVALRTVARAREALVKEGLLTPGRNASSAADAIVLAQVAKEMGRPEPEPVPEPLPEPEPEPPPKPEQPAAPRGAKTGGMVDGEALRQMNEMLDTLADEDDEITRKRMLRQVKRFAFDPNLHPDTRMSASQLWAKLLDMAQAKALGPGKPLNVLDALARAKDFLAALGVRLAVRALLTVFSTEQVLAEVNALFGETPDGEQSTQAVDESHAAEAPAQPAGPPDNNA